jgi:hypothetical protein
MQFTAVKRPTIGKFSISKKVKVKVIVHIVYSGNMYDLLHKHPAARSSRLYAGGSHIGKNGLIAYLADNSIMKRNLSNLTSKTVIIRSIMKG